MQRHAPLLGLLTISIHWLIFQVSRSPRRVFLHTRRRHARHLPGLEIIQGYRIGGTNAIDFSFKPELF
jgi:hypothetical protein